MLLLIFSTLVAAAVTLGTLVAWARTAAERDPMTVRLREIRARRGAVPAGGLEERPPLLLDLIARLGGFLPAREGRMAMHTGLVRAGFRSPHALMVFLGSKVALATLLPFAWIAFGALTGRPIGNVVLLAAAWSAVGFYLPTMFVALRQHRRRAELGATLPDALDLLVVCVEAGLGVAAALQRVSGEMLLVSRAISEEFALVHQQMQAGVSRAESLRNLAARTGVDDVYALVAMLIQTDRLGTGVGNALRVHAEGMRVKRRQRAEQQARKAAVKLAFPLVFLMLPALFIIILGPAAIAIMKALASP